MSIIQEALRKAQRKDILTEADNPKRPAAAETKKADRVIETNAKPKNLLKSALYASIFIIVLSILAIQYFSTIPRKVTVNLSAPVKDAPSIFESHPVIQLSKPASAEIQPVEDFTLSGIMHLEDGPRAIINGSTVVEGDVVGSAVVTRIEDNSVVLKKQNSEIVLHLK